MDDYDRVAASFQNLIEQTTLSVDAIADVASAAAEQASQALLAERKLVVVAAGPDAAAAVCLMELLRKGLYRERPALPAVELIARHAEPQSAGVAWLCEQLQALGQPGDLVLVFAATLSADSVLDIATAAAQRECTTVWFGAQGPGASLVYPDASSDACLLLNQASAICLVELIDIQTFGE